MKCGFEMEEKSRNTFTPTPFAIMILVAILLLLSPSCVQEWPAPAKGCGDGECDCATENWATCPSDCASCELCPNNLPVDHTCNGPSCCQKGEYPGQNAACCPDGYCVIYNDAPLAKTHNCGSCSNDCSSNQICIAGMCQDI